jgi:uncharacterized Zn finger protein (UPF0148 family)
MTAPDPEFACPQCGAMVAVRDGDGTCHRCGSEFEIEDSADAAERELDRRAGLYLRERVGKKTEVPRSALPGPLERLEAAICQLERLVAIEEQLLRESLCVLRPVVEALGALVATGRANTNQE